MFTRTHACIATTIAFVCFSSSASAVIATTASVYLKGDPGSWVSGAVGSPEATWVHGIDGVFYGDPNYSDFTKGVRITYDNGLGWSFEFAAPAYNPVTNTANGQLLHVGLYKNAQRFPFNSPTLPGMAISGNGRGDNTLSGWFNVLDIGYTPAGELRTFAVDFRQFDETPTSTGPSLYGSLRFNSAIALTPVPEPATGLLFLCGLAAAMMAARRGRERGIEHA